MRFPGHLQPRRIGTRHQQQRLLSAVFTPLPDTRHGARGRLLEDRHGGLRSFKLKKADGIPTVDAQSLLEARQRVEWWDENFMVNAFVLKGDGEHFCGGLDLTGLRGAQEEQVRECLEGLCELVNALQRSDTPAVSVIDGTCVGSAYAFAMGRYKFATENSVFYVPEPTLGLGLAGGLSHVLPRLLGGNRPLAMCLALTGMALEGPDLFFTQLATTYMTHRRMDMLMERLYEVNHDPRPFADDTPETVGDLTAEQVLLERSSELSWNVDGLSADVFNDTKGPVPITPFVHDVLPQVEEVFAANSVEEIIEKLEGRTERWAQIALHSIRRSSPLSLKVIFEQVRRGKDTDLKHCLKDEVTVNTHLFGLPDFEAAMQARDSAGATPAWRCGSLEQISEDQVAAIFEPVSQ